MATIVPIQTRVSDDSDREGWTSQWPTMLNGDTGAAAGFVSFSDRSVQVTGTFGAGGTVLIEGSNDGTNFATLTDPQGVALSITTAGIKAMTEVAKFVRPRVSAGDGTTSLTVTMLLRRTRP